MRKKILVFILIAVMVLPLVAMFTACNRTGAGSDLILTGGSRPQYDSLFSSEDKALINAALATNASETVKKEAAMALFDTANYSRKNTDLSLMLQQSNAGIDFGDVVMHAFNLKAGDAWYYQLATQVSTGNEFADGIMTLFAGFLKVAYTNGDGNYWYSVVQGSQSQCDCTPKTFPYATFVLTQEPTCFDEAAFKEELHYLDSMHEINNMQFCKEILADGLEITYDSVNKFYTVKFSVNMSADRNLIKRWYAMAQKDMQVSGNSINFYYYYNAELEVWDNGYAKSFKSYSSRDAGMASGKPVDEFTYLWVRDEILELLHEDESVERSAFMHTPEEFIEYYSHPSTEKAQMSKSIIGLIVAASIIGAILLACVITVIVLNVLMKKGKLPKLAQKRDARLKKRLDKKAARKAKKAKKRGYDVDDDEDEDDEDNLGYSVDELEDVIATQKSKEEAKVKADETEEDGGDELE